MKLGLSVLLVLLCGIAVAQAADWGYQGGDAGMTKYSADNLPDGVFQQVYSKRFYSKYSADINAAYNIATSVLIRGGQAWIISNDAPDNGNWYSPVVATKFDYTTGTTVTHSNLPGYSIGSKSFHANQNNAEIDSNHFNFPAVWAADGRMYARRGGDQRCIGAMDTTTGSWTMLPADGAAQAAAWAGDAAAFINVYGNKLLYVGGDTRDNWPYAACDISPTAWGSGMQGKYSFPVSIESPFPGGSGQFYDGLRHGDIPKAADNIAVVASWSTDAAFTHKMYLTATNLSTGQKAWGKNYANDNAGATGFYTCTADYWRFVATEDGNYAYFVRNGGQTQLHIADITTGTDKVSQALAANSDPIMGYNQNFLYVVSATQQMKINATTGAIAWQTANNFTSDNGYTPWEDPTYKPMVLTNDTMWFVDGSTMGNGHLIGMRTSDGAVIQNIDLAALVTGKNANERLIAVNDLVEANGLLGVLLDVGDVTDPNYNTTSKIKYQDLYTFGSSLPGDANRDGKVTFADYIALELGFGTSGGWSAGDFNGDGIVNFKDYIILESNFNRGVPEPATMSLVALGGLAMLMRRK